MKNQDNRVLEYIKNKGSINPFSSMSDIGVYRLSAVVFRLKSKGHNIISTRKNVKNRYGEKCSIAEYRFGL